MAQIQVIYSGSLIYNQDYVILDPELLPDMKCHSHSETSTCLNLWILLIHLSLIRNILADSWITLSVEIQTCLGKAQLASSREEFTCWSLPGIVQTLATWKLSWASGLPVSGDGAALYLLPQHQRGWGPGQGLQECGWSTHPVRNPDWWQCRAPGFLAQILSVRQSTRSPSASLSRWVFYLQPWASLMAQMVANLPDRRPGFNPWFGKVLWRREWLPIPVF